MKLATPVIAVSRSHVSHVSVRTPSLVRLPFASQVGEAVTPAAVRAVGLCAAESTGRALGSSEFVAALERLTGRRLRPHKPRRKPSERADQPELQMPGMRSGE
jgi:hypothetical protein